MPCPLLLPFPPASISCVFLRPFRFTFLSFFFPVRFLPLRNRAALCLVVLGAFVPFPILSLSLCLFIFFLATSPALVINTGNSPVIIFLLSFLLHGYSAVTRYLHCLVSQASVHLSHSLAQLDQLPSIHANNRKPTRQICPSAHSLVLVALLIPPRLNQRTTYARRQPWIQPSEYLSSGICGSPNLLEHR
ncbi:hypothetical protein K456DRAFT_1259658 [Colletotrichum gloeosporioides 23]|nr:hypothetical protein K456DRAFT_1259658 [Colletotrichum gloeosporioides 23]